MKVTIWQKFSSNHSGGFTIIGVFNEPETAQQAKAKLEAIFKRISLWHENNPEESLALMEQWDDYPPPMSPVEKEIAQELGVYWIGAIDWYKDVQVYILLERMVFVEPDGQVDYGPDPFDQIMNRFGGKDFVAGVGISGEYYGRITFHLSCEAPNQDIVQSIVDEKKPKEELPITDPEASFLRIYDNSLSFYWEHPEGDWILEKLIEYLQAKGCTNLRLQVSGLRYKESNFLDINDDEKSESS